MKQERCLDIPAMDVKAGFLRRTSSRAVPSPPSQGAPPASPPEPATPARGWRWGSALPPWLFRITIFFTSARATQSPISFHAASAVVALKPQRAGAPEMQFDLPTAITGNKRRSISAGALQRRSVTSRATGPVFAG